MAVLETKRRRSTAFFMHICSRNVRLAPTVKQLKNEKLSQESNKVDTNPVNRLGENNYFAAAPKKKG